ncbi:hypothetical protein PVAP13_6NG352700 [Panicum virgatum]|uniref:Uncharacterized protein n=1 Tax=Panicum virgatum TaxID=38727 RepID=A0A8T0R6E1_PANVG|nr:hypothetical protein PVAP13_6NG352700 [Panicum virgatum]
MPIPFQSMAERSELPCVGSFLDVCFPATKSMAVQWILQKGPRMVAAWCQWPGSGARRRWDRGRRRRRAGRGTASATGRRAGGRRRMLAFQEVPTASEFQAVDIN